MSNKLPCLSCGAEAHEECKPICGRPPKETVNSAAEMPPFPPRVFFEENEEDDGPDMKSAQLRGTDYTNFEYLSLEEHTALLADAIQQARKDAFEECAKALNEWTPEEMYLSYMQLVIKRSEEFKAKAEKEKL